MDNIKVGLIGFGLSGRVFHAPFIDVMDEFQLSAIYTTNSDSIEYIKNRYPQTKVFDNVEYILNDSDIELVIIASPNKYHYSLAKEAIEKGKHVIIEKPFVIDSIKGRELIKIAQEHNKILTVFHNRRFDSDFMTIKGVIDSKQLGELVEFESYYNRYRNALKGNWRECDEKGSGILYDLGSHLIDQALCLFGNPERVFSDVRIQRKISKAVDYFQVIMYYGEDMNNLKVTLKAGMLILEQTPRYYLTGERGNFVKYGLDVQEAHLKTGEEPGADGWGQEPQEIFGTLNVQNNGVENRSIIKSHSGNYGLYFKNIYEVIREGKLLEVSAEQALKVIEIIELAEQSSIEGRVLEVKK